MAPVPVKSVAKYYHCGGILKSFFLLTGAGTCRCARPYGNVSTQTIAGHQSGDGSTGRRIACTPHNDGEVLPEGLGLKLSQDASCTTTTVPAVCGLFSLLEKVSRKYARTAHYFCDRPLSYFHHVEPAPDGSC